MTPEEELQHLRKVNTELRIAFNNVSQEREYLRNQVTIIRDMALQIAASCKMYEGQKNAKSLEEIEIEP